MLYKEKFGEESLRQNSQNSELLHRPKGKTRKHEKGEKKLYVNRMRLFLKQIHADIWDSDAVKSTELPWQIKRESQINNHCNLNQLAQCIRNRGGRSHTTTNRFVLKIPFVKNTHHQFLCAFPEVWEQVRNIAVRLTSMERATAKGLSTTRALLPPEAVWFLHADGIWKLFTERDTARSYNSVPSLEHRLFVVCWTGTKSWVLDREQIRLKWQYLHVKSSQWFSGASVVYLVLNHLHDTDWGVVSTLYVSFSTGFFSTVYIRAFGETLFKANSFSAFFDPASPESRKWWWNWL